jgi:hypothetical protein
MQRMHTNVKYRQLEMPGVTRKIFYHKKFKLKNKPDIQDTKSYGCLESSHEI